MKNVNEARVAIGAGIEAGAKIAADGRLGVDDLGHVFGVITKASEAIDDAKDILPELSQASNDDMDASDQIIKGQLQSFNEESLRDIAKIENGVVAVFRMVARSKQEGIIEGQKMILDQLKGQGYEISSLSLYGQ